MTLCIADLYFNVEARVRNDVLFCLIIIIIIIIMLVMIIIIIMIIILMMITIIMICLQAVILNLVPSIREIVRARSARLRNPLL